MIWGRLTNLSVLSPSIAGRLALAAFALSALATPALAHGGGHDHRSWLPLVGFLVASGLLGASVYLDATDSIDRGVADAGVFLGVLGVLASVLLYWL